jgi:hypothetical protein
MSSEPAWPKTLAKSGSSEKQTSETHGINIGLPICANPCRQDATIIAAHLEDAPNTIYGLWNGHDKSNCGKHVVPGQRGGKLKCYAIA